MVPSTLISLSASKKQLLPILIFFEICFHISKLYAFTNSSILDMSNYYERRGLCVLATLSSHAAVSSGACQLPAMGPSLTPVFSIAPPPSSILQPKMVVLPSQSKPAVFSQAKEGSWAWKNGTPCSSHTGCVNSDYGLLGHPISCPPLQNLHLWFLKREPFPFRFGFPPSAASMSRHLPLCKIVLLPAPLLLCPWVYTFTLLSPDSLVSLPGGKTVLNLPCLLVEESPLPLQGSVTPQFLYFLPFYSRPRFSKEVNF